MVVNLHLPEKRLRPGAVLTGEVSWEGARPAEEIAVTLLWYTSGKGDEDAEVAGKWSVRARESAGREAFRLELPSFPWSFSGQLVSLIWAVEAGNAADGVERVSFVVAPGGEEIRL